VAVIDIPARRIDARVVYYGPGGGGKTTTLRWIAKAFPQRVVGELRSLAHEDGRTLFLDDLPLDLGDVGGWRVRLQLVGVPGQSSYERTRRALLAGVDGVIFVADSDPARRAANRESLLELKDSLAAAGHRLDRLPMVIQVNKRDLPGTVPVPTLLTDLGLPDAEAVPTVATTGEGVLAALRQLCRRVAHSL
jgi:hypothetical protein